MKQRQPTGPGPFDNTSVLLVEDDYLVGIALRRMLEDFGCEVNGPIADLATAQRSAEAMDFDCALLDINIRGGSSEPVAEVLNARGTPFLFITGYQSPLLIREAMKSIVRLRKPVEARTLQRALGKAMGAN